MNAGKQFRLFKEPGATAREIEQMLVAKTQGYEKKNQQLKKLEHELRYLKWKQITDIYADFPTRLGCYVKIRLIQFTLNKFKS